MNIQNIRLVKFPCGNYGVRRGWLFHKYYDFVGGGLYQWRGLGDKYFSHCKVSYEDALGLYNLNQGQDEVLK